MRCAAAKIEPLIATGRQPHHPSWRERFAAPLPAPENPTPGLASADTARQTTLWFTQSRPRNRCSVSSNR